MERRHLSRVFRLGKSVLLSSSIILETESLERELFLVDEDVEFASVGDKDLYQQRGNHACLNC